MKLPTENSGKGEEQPVAESGGNSGGPSAEGASGQQGSAPPSSGSSNEGSSNNAQGSSNQSGSQEVDFSEYLWMENEEEFDSQVLQELEDEEMINYYYELYEASLNENGTWGPNTANIRVTGPPPPYVPSGGPQEDDAVNSLAQGLSSRLTLEQSRLNPEAAEFVPRTPNMSSPN